MWLGLFVPSLIKEEEKEETQTQTYLNLRNTFPCVYKIIMLIFYFLIT